MSWDGYNLSIVANRYQQMFITNYLDISGRLLVNSGDVSFNNGNLYVAGNVGIGMVANSGYELDVSGDVRNNGKLFVAYDASLNSRLVVGSDVTVNKRLFTVGDSSLNGKLFVAYDASLNSRLVVGSDVTVNKRLFTVGDVSFNNGNLFVGLDTSLNGNLVIGKDLTIKGRLNVQNYTNNNIINTTVNNYQLIVSEDLSLNGRLVASSDITVNKITVGRGGGDLSTNTVLGISALASNTTGANNTALGANAGTAGTANLTGSNNTYVGYNAKANGSAYTQSTALGANAIITASNQVVLGTTTETVVIPRITRFLSPPIIYRTALGTQTLATTTDTIIEYPTLGTSSTYTGITYSSGTFTNSNSYSIGVCITGYVVFNSNATGIRSVYIQNPVSLSRMGHMQVQAITVAGEPTIATASACIVMAAGESFRMVGFQSSGGTLTIGTSGSQVSAISIMVL